MGDRMFKLCSCGALNASYRETCGRCGINFRPQNSKDEESTNSV